MRLAVARLAQLQPDVLLVEKSVARNAQEALLNNGVSLALNVKRSTLDRVARCTGAQVGRLAMSPVHALIMGCSAPGLLRPCGLLYVGDCIMAC